MTLQRLSIILPVYNQADHISRIVEEYQAALENMPASYELLLVVNGSRDQSLQACQALAQRMPTVRALHSVAGGWGLAVRLGLREATGGRFRAHVLRVKRGADHSTLHTTGLHRHHLDFQMIFILKGWIRFTYEGQGEKTFGPGDCCVQPPGIVHNELDCSDDLELLEITSPADFRTEPLTP